MSRVEPRDRPEGKKFKVATSKRCQDIIRNGMEQQLLVEGQYPVERKKKTAQLQSNVWLGGTVEERQRSLPELALSLSLKKS